MSIHFGTSGWRVEIADEFNCAQARTATTGTATIPHAIRTERAVCGINFTSSHKLPQHNADRALALPNVTRQIERLIADSQPESSETGNDPTGAYGTHRRRSGYLSELTEKINFTAIARARGRYAYAPGWGAGRGYLDQILKMHGLEVHTIHNWRDLPGGRSPEPEGSHLDDLREVVLTKGCVLGLATDRDGDRFSVIDSDGTFITPNQLMALLFDYLAESRGWTGGVARSVATSHLVDRVAQARRLPVYETPAGFRDIGELINEDKIILGGEESAGLSIKGHYPEKNGIVACLLAAEAVAARGASLTEQLDALYARVGKLEDARIGVRITPHLMPSLNDKLDRDQSDIGGRRVERTNRTDGVNFIFADGCRFLMRLSGTEPLVRVCAESESAKDLEVLLEQGRKYLLG